MKRHQLENIVPSIFTLLSIYIISTKFPYSLIDHITFLIFFLAVILVGVGLGVWWAGKLSLGDSFTTSPKANKLIKTGIYSRLKHPIYFGLILLLVGWMILSHNLFTYLLCIIPILTSIVRAKIEEQVLMDRFGKTYLRYKKTTFL